MRKRIALPILGLTLALILAGCQAPQSSSDTSASGTASVSSSSTASAADTAPSDTASPHPLAITEEYTAPSTVAEIKSLGDYIKAFDYKDITAAGANAAWKELTNRATITAYPTGMLEYTEYSLYQHYLKTAIYYETDLDTMLKEEMNITHDELLAEVQREAKQYIDAGLIARYILEKENLVTPEAIAEITQLLTGDAVESSMDSEITGVESETTGGETVDGSSQPAPTALNISTELALELAKSWITANLVTA